MGGQTKRRKMTQKTQNDAKNAKFGLKDAKSGLKNAKLRLKTQNSL